MKRGPNVTCFPGAWYSHYVGSLNTQPRTIRLFSNSQKLSRKQDSSMGGGTGSLDSSSPRLRKCTRIAGFRVTQGFTFRELGTRPALPLSARPAFPTGHISSTEAGLQVPVAVPGARGTPCAPAGGRGGTGTLPCGASSSQSRPVCGGNPSALRPGAHLSTVGFCRHRNTHRADDRNRILCNNSSCPTLTSRRIHRQGAAKGR